MERESLSVGASTSSGLGQLSVNLNNQFGPQTDVRRRLVAADLPHRGCLLPPTSQGAAVDQAEGYADGVAGSTYEAMALWFQGRPDQARLWIEKGLAVARETHYAFTIAAALSFATQLEQLCRDAAATEALAERTIAYCQEQGFPLYLGAALAHRGWARATQGDVARGLEDLVTGITLYRATGAVLNVNYLLALLVEAYLLAGDRARGLGAADEGLALAAEHLDTYFVAELHRIRGALLLLEPADSHAAEAALREALAVAHTQDAAELALRAAVGLGRLLGERGRRPRPARCSPSTSHAGARRGTAPIWWTRMPRWRHSADYSTSSARPTSTRPPQCPRAAAGHPGRSRDGHIGRLRGARARAAGSEADGHRRARSPSQGASAAARE